MPHLFRKNVTDEEIRVYMQPEIARMMAFVVPHSPVDGRGDARMAEHARGTKQGKNNREEGRSESQPDPTTDELEFLESISRHPDAPNSQRYSLLGLSADRGNRTRKRLLKHHFIEQVDLNFGRRTGGRVSMLMLTDRGYAALGMQPPPHRPLNCSAEHWWWQQRLCREARDNGHEAEIEKSLDGKHHADVAFRKNGEWNAIEVTFSVNNVLENVRGDLQSGFQAVLVACGDDRRKQAAAAELNLLSVEERSRVKLLLLSDFAFVKQIISKKTRQATGQRS